MNPLDLGVGSHVPVLAAMVIHTDGPILECGTGNWSTPLLHAMGAAMGREVVSLETSSEWIEKVKPFKSPNGDILYTQSILCHHLVSKKWGLAFVDSSPGEQRIDVVRKLKGVAKFIVLHDREADIPPAGGNYGWKHLEGMFKNEVIYDLVRPWTSIVSDEDIPKIMW